MEEDDQQGMAHYLEHMAFNGKPASTVSMGKLKRLSTSKGE